MQLNFRNYFLTIKFQFMKLNHVDNSAQTIQAALGITEERTNVLQENFTKSLTNESITSVSGMLEAIADFCETPEEFGWLAYEFGTKSGAGPDDLGSIFEALTEAGVAEEGNDDSEDFE